MIEWLYAALALLFGLTFLFLVPPGWNNDEQVHYLRAYEVANGVIKEAKLSSNSQRYGGLIDDNVIEFIKNDSLNKKIDRDYRFSFPPASTPGFPADLRESGQKSPTSLNGAAVYSPAAYLPQAAGIRAAQALHLPYYSGFLLAKILGLVASVAMIFWAIRLVPKGKWIIFSIGLLPMTVVQSSALSADGITTALCLLAISATLAVAFNRKPSTRFIDLIPLYIVIPLMGLVKPTYLPLVLLLAVIPIMRKEFRRIKKLVLLAIPVAAAIVLAFGWLSLIGNIPTNTRADRSPSEQKSYIMQRPDKFIKTLLRTTLTVGNESIDFRRDINILGYFMSEHTALPVLFMLLSVASVTLSCTVASRREITESVAQRRALKYGKLLMVSIFVVIALLMAVALYLQYTPLYSNRVVGLQGRYFIPILPLVLLPLVGIKLSSKDNLHVKRIIVIFVIVCLLATTAALVGRLYI